MKRVLFFSMISLCFAMFSQPIFAIDLLSVYHQAQQSDPTFQQALAQKMADMEKVPQSVAALLPQINLTGSAGLSKSIVDSDISTVSTATSRQRTLAWELSLEQSVFNFSYWQNLSEAKDSVKASVATFNAAQQDLMVRTAQAYFNVLQAADVLRFTGAEKAAFYQEYIRALQSFKVGIKTITDVYNAKAAYDGSIADYVTAKNDLANKQEDLRSITGQLYKNLATLKTTIPLVKPNPSDINRWCDTSMQQNWEYIADRYNASAAHKAVKSAFGGHLPTLSLAAKYDNDYTRSFDIGRTRAKGPSAELDLTVPIFSGGNVTSQVRQKMAEYQVASQAQEATARSVINQTRKSYLGVESGISKVNANGQEIVSNRSSLEGMQEGYKVGTRTMVDVLNAQKALYESQKDYAISRYSYILSGIELKQAAGTLNEQDLQTINTWLQNHSYSKRMPVKTTTQKKIKKTVVKKDPVKQDKIQTTYFVQAGVYSKHQHAESAMGKINNVTNAPVRIYSHQTKNRTLYSVKVGPISYSVAKEVKEKLGQTGFSETYIVKK